ncbi:MAG: thiaminase II [Tannerella sp.]|jgi:thiaminase/transcriptional activator TenA|nr:thiaminase II [Tannerella sp.]
MKWSEKAWEAIWPIYKETLNLPFIQELVNGTLDKEKFTFYIQQDALYLSDYGRILTAIATKLTKSSHIEAFISFAGESIAVENVLHQTFCTELRARGKQTPSPSCLLYTSFLLRQLNAPLEVMTAAVLPCFRIYKEVGDYILANQTPGNNPYQAWINTYGGDEYAQSVEKAVNVCDELAEKCTKEQQDAMTEAFVTCSKLEWMFWDSAYNLEQWKI